MDPRSGPPGQIPLMRVSISSLMRIPHGGTAPAPPRPGGAVTSRSMNAGTVAGVVMSHLPRAGALRFLLRNGSRTPVANGKNLPAERALRSPMTSAGAARTAEPLFLEKQQDSGGKSRPLRVAPEFTGLSDILKLVLFDQDGDEFFFTPVVLTSVSVNSFTILRFCSRDSPFFCLRMTTGIKTSYKYERT